MAERKLYQPFQDKLKKADPDCFCYKIPDTFKWGGKKPFDFFIVCKGKPFAVEFKEEDDATPYQEVMLRLFKTARGISILYIKEEMTLDELVFKIVNHS